MGKPRILRMFQLREFLLSDADQVNALAVHAFEQYQASYTDWPTFRSRIDHMSALAQTGELVVAEVDGRVVGAVVYVGPGVAKADFFEPQWPIMRMLVVEPQARGQGVGKALAQECIARAQRDGANTFALHTSELMTVALPMYLRMGFRWHSAAPMLHGVRYDVYVKVLVI